MIAPNFLYIEKSAKDYELTNKICAKFKNSSVIEINSYKEIFNRKNQNFLAQKKNTHWILSKKKDNFLYKGSIFCQNFGHENYYYSTPILNCIYNCEYCFLQGMYDSASLVVFVNVLDFFQEILAYKIDHKLDNLFVSISYETDMLAMERFISVTGQWIEFAQKNRDIYLEIRTKSNQFHQIQSLEPVENVILAWTISPKFISHTMERKAPSIEERLRNVQLAMQRGWKVRICLDPILYVQNWKRVYSDMIDLLFEKVDPDRIYDIGLGGFRMNVDFLKKIQSLRTNSQLLHSPFFVQNKVASYPQEIESSLVEYVHDLILKKTNRVLVYVQTI